MYGAAGKAKQAVCDADRKAGNWQTELNAPDWAGRYFERADEPFKIGPFGSVADNCKGAWDSCRYCGRRCRGWCCMDCCQFYERNRHNCEIFHEHFKGKMAYFIPMGNGGEGVPVMGHYQMVYAADPGYFDPRDAGVYAAQGYGVPISVPLPPTVRHTMNYSTGMPSSRLTPISNVVQPRRGW